MRGGKETGLQGQTAVLLKGGGIDGEQVAEALQQRLRQGVRCHKMLLLLLGVLCNLFSQRKHLSVDCHQRFGKRLGHLVRQLFAGKEIGFSQRCRIHPACAVHQVVRFVDQEGIAVPVVKKSAQVDDGVEQVVVIADDSVAPERQVQSQLEGTQLTLFCPAFDDRSGEGVLLLEHLKQHVRHPVVVAFGIGTVVGVAQPLGQKADAVLGGQAHPAQPQSFFLHSRKGFFCCQTGGIFCGQIENVGELAFAQRLDGRKEGRDGFADAGGSLTEDTGAVFGSAVDDRCHLPLTGSVFRKREGKLFSTSVAQLLPVKAHHSPAVVAGKQVQIKLRQLFKGKPMGEGDGFLGFQLAVD